MKKIVLLCILNVFIFSSVVNAGVSEFNDLENHWAKEDILFLINEGVVSGYPDGSFKPENNITIVEFVKMLVHVGEYKLVRVGNNIYPDFYISTAEEIGLIEENEYNDFNKNLTRHEMVNIISKFINLKDVKKSNNVFKDLEKENKDNVLKLVELKIINGYSDNTFKGKNNISRAEAAVVICRALKVRDELILNRKYDIEVEYNLSNYINKTNDNIYEKQTSIKTFYEIDNNKMKIYDNGRYAILDGYVVSDNKLNTEKIIKIIRKLINEKAYVGVLYVPSKYTINELKILYGKEEEKVLCGEYDFAFNYYENKNYELANKSLHEEFSNKCYMRIDVVKLWDDYSDYKNGVYVSEYKKEKFESALKLEFGSASTRILEYMIDKNIKYVTNVECDKEHVEQKIFGSYIVNYYQKEYGIPQFYIERK